MDKPPKRATSKKLGTLLLERKVIKEKELEDALEVQKENKSEPLGKIFIELGYATEEDITEALTTQFAIPFLPLTNYHIDQDIANLIPKDIADSHGIIAVDKIEKSLSVAISDPLNAHVIRNDIEAITDCDVRVFISTPSSIRECIKQCYKFVIKE